MSDPGDAGRKDVVGGDAETFRRWPEAPRQEAGRDPPVLLGHFLVWWNQLEWTQAQLSASIFSSFV